MITFTMLHPRATTEMLGYIPQFFSESDPRPAAEQLDEAYSHGGGWSPMPKWRMSHDGIITYPGDNPLKPIAMAMLRNETIYVYQHAWVGIVQPDKSYQVSRVD